AVVVGRVVAAGDRDAGAGLEVEGAEVHHRRRRHADVDDVAAGLAQATRKTFDQVRPGQSAVAADDDVFQALFLHQRTDRLADQLGHAGVERLPDHAADVVGAEDAAVDAHRRGPGRVAHLHLRLFLLFGRAV